MLRADLLRRFAHGAQLVGQRVSPEVGQQQGAEEESNGAVAGAPWRLHLCVTDGLNVKFQDHDREDDHPKRKDEGRPWFYFALVLRQSEKQTTRRSQILFEWHKDILRLEFGASKESAYI